MATPITSRGNGNNANSNANVTSNSRLLAQSRRSKQSLMHVRVVILAICLGYLIPRLFRSTLLPYGPPIKMEVRPTYVSSIDKSNQSLMLKSGKLKKIYERSDTNDKKKYEKLLKGPETVVFDPDSKRMFILTEDANLVELSDFQPMSDENPNNNHLTAKATMIADLGKGRPLGGRFVDGTLYIADAVLGLTRLREPGNPKSKLELVASTFIDKDGTLSKINFADDVIVGPTTGMVYFTDATEILPEQNRHDLEWDVMYASKVDLLRGRKTGRLFQYDPITENVTVLASDLWFANGITIDQDETFVMFAESFSLRIGKYHLQGEKKGTVEYVINGKPSPGYFDGLDCAWKGITADTSDCFAIMPSTIVPLNKIIWNIPHPLDLLLRTMLLMVPKWIVPPVTPYGGIMQINHQQGMVKILQDPTGQDIGKLTGVTVFDNKLYLGSLRNDYIGVYDLSE